MQQTKYLKDYTPPEFLIDKVDLHFTLQSDVTIVKSKLQIRKNPEISKTINSLILDGEKLQLRYLKLNDEVLAKEHYQITETTLTIPNLAEQFILEIEVAIEPKKNTALSGLYVSNANYCTQCEAHGFHFITYFLDRPDVLTRFTTTIVADKNKYPVLLSNGNLAASGEDDTDKNLHWVKWEDPSLKPAYLFALVAGNFIFTEETYKTLSGRAIKLRVYAELGAEAQCHHALHCLVQAMRWDEEVFGLEYELSIYMIVAINDFNAGAMENKGLNIFNSRYVLVSPETATDFDYLNVTRVVAHEYFHNWTGNRIICRDWFQLGLKEGLTTFRENLFMQQNYYKTVQRINDVRFLKTEQFAEDASSLAHPVRPKSYIKVDNFYTYTVYNKGAEIPHMLPIILGPKTFHQVMDLFFKRFDGKAITVEDFIKCVEDITHQNFAQFQRWYDQAGTPILHIESKYNQNNKTLTLKVRQESDKPENKDFYIPLAIGLLDQNGNEIPLRLQNEAQDKISPNKVLHIKNKEQEFCFININKPPILSLLRDFSAPVKLDYPYDNDELKFLALHDPDIFNRWQAAQELLCKIMLDLIAKYQAAQPLILHDLVPQIFKTILYDNHLEPIVKANLLQLPSESYLLELLEVADVEAVYNVSEFVKLNLAKILREDFLTYYHANQTPIYNFTADEIGKRSLKNLCLYYLMYLDNEKIIDLCLQQYNNADNMTDIIGSLNPLVNSSFAKREEILENFYRRWQQNPLVVEKWLAINATIKFPETLSRIQKLVKHPAFSIYNPNKVYALLRTFAKLNHINFHNPNGKGYELLVKQIMEIDEVNAQLAARLLSLSPLMKWKRFDVVRQNLMQKQLRLLAAKPKISSNAKEIVEKVLND